MLFLCTSSALAEGASINLVVGQQQILAVRRAGTAYVYANRCPHRQVPLNWRGRPLLPLQGSLIECAHHGALFQIETGECVAGPCEGDVLHALPYLEDEQGLWLLDDPEAATAEPQDADRY